MLTRLLLIFLLVLFVGRALWRLLQGVVEGATGGRSAAIADARARHAHGARPDLRHVRGTVARAERRQPR